MSKIDLHVFSTSTLTKKNINYLKYFFETI